MGRFRGLAAAVVIGVGLSSCASAPRAASTPQSSTTASMPASTTVTVDAGAPVLPVDPARLVLRTDDYPAGRVDDDGRADLYDEPPAGFEAILDAAGLAPSTGAYTRSFHIPGIRSGSISSFAVAVKTPALAAALFRNGANGLLVFNGFAGGLPGRASADVPLGLGSEALAFSAAGSNGGTELAVVWRRNRAVGVLIVDRSDGDPRPQLERFSKLMDDRMRALA